jgi:TP901 family phage tail tape measure protein
VLNNLGLGLVFTAKDLASGHIQRLERTFLSMEGSITGGSDRIQASFKQLGTGLTIFAAGAATLAGAYVFASAAGKFQEAIAAVGAVSNATTADLHALHDAALEAGIQTQYTPTEATKGLYELAQAGFTAQESIKLLIPALDLAAGSLGELTPETAAGVAAQAMKAFGVSVEGASFAVDQMLQAANVFALRAGDLPLALGHAADGANALKQSLGETLIALGLIRNVIPGVERASTAASVAMQRLADPRVQKTLHGIGVEVTHGHGEFRKFLDVLGDLAPKLQQMTEQQRAAFLLHAFGHHALSGVGAILTQITNGIRTETGVTLQGAAAVGYLRDQFDHAGGAAATFRDKMLDTFEGQKKLLRGSVETLAIVLGEPMAAAFKPIVTTITDGLNAVLALIKKTPEPVNRLFAMLTLVAGTFLTLVGGVVAAQGAIAILSIGAEALGVSFGAIVATLGTAIAVLGVLGVIVAGLRVAWDRNLGGIADKVTRVGEVIRLVFQGVSQFIEQGGFSGALRDELNRAENAGVKRFLVQLWMVGYRLERFWTGLKDGFASALEGVSPLFKELGDSFDALSSAIGEVFGAISGGAAALPSDTFSAWGKNLGQDFAWLAASGAALLSALLSLFAGLVRGGRETFGWISGAVAALGDALSGLGVAWDELTGKSQNSAAEFHGAAGDFEDLGRVIGVVLGGAVTIVTWLLNALVRTIHLVLVAVNAVKLVFGGAADFITALGRAIVWFFAEALPNALGAAKDAIASALGKLGEGAAAVFGFGPSGPPSAAGEGDSASPLAAASSRLAQASARVATAPMPAAAAEESDNARTTSLEQALAAASARPSSRDGDQPITVNVQVDGETLARASARASRDVASRSFAPVPVY